MAPASDVGAGAFMGAGVGMVLAGPIGAAVGAGVGGAAAATSGDGELQQTLTGVQLPSDGMQVQNDETFFAIDVFAASGATWRVMKSGANFTSLRSTVKASGAWSLAAAEHPAFGVQYPADPWPCCPCFILANEEKRARLEAWLDHIIKKDNSHWVRPLQGFLQLRLDGQVHATAPQVQQMQQPVPATAPQVQQMQQPLMQPLLQPSNQEAPTVQVDVVAKLQQLVSLHQTGILSDEEFASAKAKVLAS